MPTNTAGSHDRGETTGPGVKVNDAEPASKGLPENQTMFRADGVPGLFVLNLTKRKGRKKRKYSRGLKDVQKAERGVTRSSLRLSKALERGLRDYRKRSDKSSHKRRDGAIRDGLENWSRALGKSVRIGSKAPADLAKRLNSRTFSRNLRDVVRFITPPLFR